MIRILIGLMLFVGGGSAAWYGFKAGWYGHKSSSVPIIHANKDPIKEKPAKPGGRKVPDRDKLIYQRLGSGAKPPASVEQLLPPAEAPISPPSMPKSDLKKTPPIVNEVVKEAVKPTTKQIARTPSEPAAPIKSPVQPVERLAPPPSPLKVEKVVPKNMLPKKPPAKVVERMPPPSPPKKVTLPVKKMVKKSPIIKPKAKSSKPLGSIESLLGDAPTKTTAAITKQTSVKTPFRVQLAAVRTRAIAQKEWSRIKKKNADVLGKLSLSVMRADLGAKGTYYRLRAGPIASEAKARALCKKLAARKVPCLVIRPNG